MKNKKNIKGQSLAELILCLSLCFMMLSLGVDFGEAKRIQQRLLSSGFDGIKIVNQANDIFFVKCYSPDEIKDKVAALRDSFAGKGILTEELQEELRKLENRKTLCQTLKEQAKASLELTGMDVSDVEVNFVMEPDPEHANPGDVIYAGVQYEAPFSYVMGQAVGVGFESNHVRSRLMTYLATKPVSPAYSDPECWNSVFQSQSFQEAEDEGNDQQKNDLGRMVCF